MLTAIVLTLNEEKHLPDCLKSLHWADEVLVFDSFSTDSTCAIAERYNARVIQHKFENYAAQRNAALQAVTADWIFFVDADERISDASAAEIQAVISGDHAEVGWWLPRHNYIFHKLTLHAGWFPDYQLRLVKRAYASYDPNRHVHELIDLDGEAGYLTEPLVHINYEAVSEFIEKQHKYTKYDASILFQDGQRVKPQNYILQPLRQFWWRYKTLAGWRGGWHGLRLSVLMGYFQFVLYKELGRLEKESSSATNHPA